MLVGKQFNRGVRGLTLAYEALMALLFKAFFNWCKDENRLNNIEPNVWKVFVDCHSSFAETSKSTDGEFSIRQKPGAHNGIWSDMATEKTIIKDSKGCSGIIGLTRKKPALLRWMLTRHILAHFSSEMKSRSGLTTDAEPEHEENKPTAMTRDEKNVSDLIGM
ncbi:unnamed protein product [Mytilus coruscus]|uniref:Uncharacterized protein n=1 Tax=Mytilus coruscus TaxID=42192 RepID=A0A6J8A1S3_MYTCO|nr:unnamed protein product [Mytilus coruscus]